MLFNQHLVIFPTLICQNEYHMDRTGIYDIIGHSFVCLAIVCSQTQDVYSQTQVVYSETLDGCVFSNTSYVFSNKNCVF